MNRGNVIKQIPIYYKFSVEKINNGKNNNNYLKWNWHFNFTRVFRIRCITKYLKIIIKNTFANITDMAKHRKGRLGDSNYMSKKSCIFSDWNMKIEPDFLDIQ